jgi:hypothetical protein
MPVLAHLDWNPKVDIEPLVPLLEKIIKYRDYNPDGLWQFEAIRIDAFKLLARRKNPIAKLLIDRYLATWPFSIASEQSSGLANDLVEGAYRLGDKSLAQPLRDLLDTLLPEHATSQRNMALGDSYKLLDKLGGKPKAATAKKKAPTRGGGAGATAGRR